MLENANGVPVAGLWSDKFEGEGPGYTTDMANFGILDFGVTSNTPDLLVLPPDIEAGSYRLCTANSRPNVCTVLEIVA